MLNNIMNLAVLVTSVLGALCARLVLSWRESYRGQRAMLEIQQQMYTMQQMLVASSGKVESSALAINYLGQQNQALTGFFISLHERVMKEVVFDPQNSDGTKSLKEASVEISCKEEFIEKIKQSMDAHSEQVLKELTMWATTSTQSFDLEISEITLETDRPADSRNGYDVVIVFHVKAKGEDALRFQAEAARRLRDMVMISHEPSVQILRCDVRWT